MSYLSLKVASLLTLMDKDEANEIKSFITL